MATYAGPALYALFVWWFSTGLIIWLNNLPTRTFRWSLLGGTGLFAACLVLLGTGASDTSAAGAYVAFTAAVLAWGWHEMTFYMGAITGPRITPSPPDASEWRRFLHGVGACLWHELAIIATAIAIVGASWGAPNQVGTWTFLALWAMRTSAKLNFFLGVLNLSDEFVPAHLGYLRSMIRQRPMNLLFPFSVTGGTVAAALLWQAAAAPGIGEVQAAGLTFVLTMMVLAVVEHWCLVLPLPFARLWSWVLQLRRPQDTTTKAGPTANQGAV